MDLEALTPSLRAISDPSPLSRDGSEVPLSSQGCNSLLAVQLSSWCPSETRAHLRPTCLGDTGGTTPLFARPVLPHPLGHALPWASWAWWLGRPLYLYLDSYVCTSNTNKCTCCQKYLSQEWASFWFGVAVQEEAGERWAGAEAKGTLMHVGPARQESMTSIAPLGGSALCPAPHKDSFCKCWRGGHCLLLWQKGYKWPVSKGSAFLFHSCQNPWTDISNF